jgi:hypothetical protein
MMLTRIRPEIRLRLSTTPYLYDAVFTYRRPSLLAQGHSTLVIEGYPRSANTFALAAFVLANQSNLYVGYHHIGHHLHTAAAVKRAVRLGRPTIVLVRDPRDAASSYVIREAKVDVVAALREYVTFHRHVWPLRDAVVIAPFEVVTTDFGRVIDAVNARFDTSFKRYEDTADNRAIVFSRVEQYNRRESKGAVVESTVARPSDDREQLRRRLMCQFERPAVTRLLATAQDLHTRYRAEAQRQLPPP